MFIGQSKRWDTSSGQHASGYFLAVFCDDSHKLWGVVRHVQMDQCGHWMMGELKIATQRLTVSGTYGGDGLPVDLDKVVPENRHFLYEVPADLQEKFWKGGGHNSAGSEARDMHDWALTLPKTNRTSKVKTTCTQAR